MRIIRSQILNKFGNLLHGVSTMDFSDANDLFGFNLSFSVGDDPQKVLENRQKFFRLLGTDYSRAAFQEQIHSDIVKIVNAPGNQGKSDAMITNKKNIALAVSIADCTPVLLYDYENKVIAGVHSGWRGAFQKIPVKTILKMKAKFNTKPENVVAYLGPSICVDHYEVGVEVAEKFPTEFVKSKNGKLFLDVAGFNYKMLLESGIPEQNIERSDLCTYEAKDVLHSYRRDGKKSGRGFAVIMMKGENE